MKNPTQYKRFREHRRRLERKKRKNPEHLQRIRIRNRQRMRQWREKNPEKARIQRRKDNRRYYERHRNEVRQQVSAYQTGNLPVVQKRHRNWHRERRLKSFKLLGGKCVRCGFSDWRALQIDHIQGGGSEHYQKRKTIGVLKDILTDPASRSKYQLLCANCNWIKRFEKSEHN